MRGQDRLTDPGAVGSYNQGSRTASEIVTSWTSRYGVMEWIYD